MTRGVVVPEADFSWLGQINLWQVAVFIIALYIIFRLLVKFWPWLRKLMTLTQALADLPAFIARTDSTLSAQDVKIDDIHHEVQYNNGSSVKDAIKRVEEGVAGLYTHVNEIDERTLPGSTSRKSAAKRVATPAKKEQ
jgi:hypothetical protein